MPLRLKKSPPRVASIKDVQRALDVVSQDMEEVRDVQQLRAVLGVTSDTAAKVDEILLCDPSAGAISISLPPAADSDLGQIFIVNDSASQNAITANAAAGDTILGSTSLAITSGRAAVQLMAIASLKKWVAV